MCVQKYTVFCKWRESGQSADLLPASVLHMCLLDFSLSGLGTSLKLPVDHGAGVNCATNFAMQCIVKTWIACGH